ncbi:hypothetical protein TVAG_147550 [Trichomonas vaginalis G3]|uniref:Uncharacterized protein n=1 Tax=Trichomonas vaginalis (strain ATCC PRA-98 / G3) TaxID=412133 RepID=A2FTM0_TRIV3|nr:hypothetical protein TVAGG3_0203960 [Trichomonas vaginalis G3]EAX91754.1 hypothetical protein TVAG_147550 [Trichomonas vaginalis G3]KAI5550797.1 hypothetical protein TVAGG3_0203960 [Trichomonas vaginalis G3]|eukprot:XP_001304684.1 hypothetical protein [Trichomonas vaginalis G3]
MFSKDQIKFTIHTMNLAYFFVFSSITNKSTDILTKFALFLQTCETARASICYALYLLCLDSSKHLIPRFLQTMNCPIGRTIMEQLFTYNTSKEFYILNSQCGQIFVQYFMKSKRYFPEMFMTSIMPLNFQIPTEVVEQKDLLPEKNVNMYLQYIMNMVIRFDSFDPIEKSQFIESNLILLLHHIFRTRNILFNIENYISVRTIDQFCTIISLFFDCTKTIIFDQPFKISLINDSFVDSVLLCMKFIMIAKIPEEFSNVFFNVKNAYNSIISFITRNSSAFTRILACKFRVSLLPAVIISASVLNLPLCTNLTLLKYVAYSTIPATVSAAVLLVRNLPPTNDLAEGMVNQLLAFYVKRTDKQNLRAIESYMTFMTIKIDKNPEFSKKLALASNFLYCYNSLIGYLAYYEENLDSLITLIILISRIKNHEPKVKLQIPYQYLFGKDVVRHLGKQGLEALFDLFIADFVKTGAKCEFQLKMANYSGQTIRNFRIIQQYINNQEIDLQTIEAPNIDEKQSLPWKVNNELVESLTFLNTVYQKDLDHFEEEEIVE